MRPANRHGLASAAGIAYAVGYLFALGDLAIVGRAAWQTALAKPWTTLWLTAKAPFQFEAIAMLQAGHLLYLASPLNTLIALLLGAAVAVNLDGVIALRSQPAECRVASGDSGVLAAVPALLAGGACCAPSLLILLGIPGLGALAALFGWLVPLSFVLLVASRWWQLRLGAPRWRAGEPGGRARPA